MGEVSKNRPIEDPQYHYIQFKEIESETQENFFDYIFEDMDVFQRAR